MKLYADTANLTDIKALNEIGIIQGVTTNPSLISKEPKGDYIRLIKTVADYCLESKLSVSVEVFNTSYDEMLAEALDLSSQLSQYSDVLKIKVPITLDGLKVINILSKEGIKTNATAAYSEQQLQLAASAGASYVSLFYCRLMQSGGDVAKVLQRTRDFIDTNNLKSEIIAGSIRTQTDVSNAWHHGAHIVTTSKSVINEMMLHPKTDEAIDQFTRDFKAWID